MKLVMYIVNIFILSISIIAQDNKCVQDKDAARVVIKQDIIPITLGSQIGFEYFDDGGEYSSVTGITLLNNYIFLGDAVNKRIIRVNLKNKSINNSEVFINDDDWLWDIVSFNQHIYAITIDKRIYKIDESLQLVNEIIIPQKINFIPYISYSSKDSLIISCFDKPGLIQIKINTADEFKIDSIFLSSLESYKIQKSLNQELKGKKYSLSKIGEQNQMKNKYGVYSLPKEIEQDQLYEHPPTFDFNESTICYYYLNETELILYVFYY